MSSNGATQPEPAVDQSPIDPCPHSGDAVFGDMKGNSLNQVMPMKKSKAYLRNITNSFQDVQLASLATWKKANEIFPRDRGGPYVILQEGYDPQDLTVTPDEFVLGRSGKWLSLSHFFRMPVPDRRAEFVFGTMAEVMEMMSSLPTKAQIFRPSKAEAGAPATIPEDDELAAALRAARGEPHATRS